MTIKSRIRKLESQIPPPPCPCAGIVVTWREDDTDSLAQLAQQRACRCGGPHLAVQLMREGEAITPGA